MCVVSAVGDHYSRRDSWPDWPIQLPFPDKSPASIPENGTSFRLGQLEKELVELKKAFAQMKAELEAAKAEDIADGNPDCEMEDKTIILKKIADLLGETLDGIFSTKANKT